MATNLGSAYVTIVPKLTGAQAAMEQQLSAVNLSGAGKAVGGGLMGGVESTVSARSVVVGNLVTSAVTAAASAVSGVVSGVMDAGIGFEAQMSTVAALSGATGESFDLLRRTAMDLGSTTKFSATECADALGFMALAGWDAQRSVEALPGVLDLAAASGMGLAEASDMVTDYLSAFGMEASQSAYLADLLAYAQANSNTSAAQLGEAYKNCAATLHASGQDVETVTSLLASMANQGLKGSEAGTALSAIMRDITQNMEGGAIAIGNTSVSVVDANGNFRDLTGILTDVEAATNGMGDAERAAALGATFTADSTKGLNLILNAGVASAAGFEDSLRGCSGAAGDMAATMQDNLQGDLTRLGSAVEGLQISLFALVDGPARSVVSLVADRAVPALTGLSDGLRDVIYGVEAAAPEFDEFGNVAKEGTEGVEGLAERLGSFKDRATEACSVAAGAAGELRDVASGAVSSFWGTASPALAGLEEALSSAATVVKDELGASFSGLPETGEQAAAWLRDSFPGATQAASSAAERLGGKVAGAAGTLASLVDEAAPRVAEWASGFSLDGVGSAFQGVVDKVSDGLAPAFDSIAEDLIPGVRDGFSALVEAMPGIQTGFGDPMEAIGGIADTVLQTVCDKVEFFSGLVGDAAKGLGETLGPAIGELSDTLGPLADTVGGSLSEAFSTYNGFVETLATTVTGLVTDGLGTLAGIVADLAPVAGVLFESVGNFCTNVAPSVQEIVGGLQPIGESLLTVVSDLGQTFAETLMPVVQTISDEVLPTFSDVLGRIAGDMPGIQSTFDGVFTAIGNVIAMTFGVACTTVSTAMTMICDVINVVLSVIDGDWDAAWNGIRDLGSDIWDGIAGIAETLFPGIGDTVSGFLTNAQTWWDETWTGVSQTTDQLWSGIKGFIDDPVGSLTGTISGFVSDVKGQFDAWGIDVPVDSVWQSLKGFIDDPIGSLTGTVSGFVSGVSSQFESWGIASTVDGIFQSVRGFIEDPISSAKTTVGELIGGIQGIFDSIHFEFPHFSIPRVVATGGYFNSVFDWQLPDFSIDWEYLANGGYFDRPTKAIIGEAGPEVAIPLLGGRMRPFARAVADEMGAFQRTDGLRAGDVIEEVNVYVQQLADIAGIDEFLRMVRRARAMVGEA